MFFKLFQSISGIDNFVSIHRKSAMDWQITEILKYEGKFTKKIKNYKNQQAVH